MYRRILACVASCGIFSLMASTQVSSVYSSLTAHAQSISAQRITSATWAVIPTATDSSTALQHTYTNISNTGSYFTIRNLGGLATSKIDISLEMSVITGNPTYQLQWCSTSTWNESAGTCVDPTKLSVLITIDKNTTLKQVILHKSFPVNDSVRMRLQKTGGNTNQTATLKVLVQVPRSYLRAPIGTQN